MEFALLLGRIRDARRMAIEQPLGGQILSLFDREDPRRAEEQYLLFRSKLIWYFDRHNCESPDDLADEALYRVTKAVATGTEIYAQNPFAFFWAVAENVRKEDWKRHKAEPLKNDQSVFRESPSNLENVIYLKECVRAALSPEEESLLRSYYQQGSQPTAKRLGVSLPYLRLKLHHIRNKVRKFAATAETKRERNV
jgi:DNA-directed RNA polymerase specialized sigma24 family protein